MGLLEWIGEAHDPGATGTVEFKADRISAVWLSFTVVRFVVTLGLFAGVLVGGTMATGTPQLLHGALAGGGFLLYLVLGYFVRPKADMSNLGWAGGLIDHPFRYSDDINRNLLFFAVVLFPGYLLARPIAEMFAFVAGEAEPS